MKKSKQSQQLSSQFPEYQGDLEEYIQILQEHQIKCQQSGKYIEAEMAKNRIVELKQELQFRRKEELKQKHVEEKVEIEKAHLNEFNEFNQFWDSKMQEFDEKASQVEEEMIARQEEDLQKFEEELEESIPQKPKDSAELLNHRKIEEQLAKQKDYIEAHKVQQICLQMETDEYEKWNAQRRQKIRNQLLQLKQKQDNELNALRQRIVSGQDEQRKVRSLELERLLQKYQNVKKELETQQQNEVIRLQKALANPGLSQSQYSAMNASKYQSNNTSRMSQTQQSKRKQQQQQQSQQQSSQQQQEVNES